MADTESLENPSPSNQNSDSACDYKTRASQACEAGDMVLGMHLYLAAYEKATAEPRSEDAIALESLREAWHLACDLKERSIAEYVFEKMEPHLTSQEAQDCAARLQDLALDRLEECGFSRKDLEGVARMISDDLLGGETSILHMEHLSLPAFGAVAEGVRAFSSSPVEEAEQQSDASEPRQGDPDSSVPQFVDSHLNPIDPPAGFAEPEADSGMELESPGNNPEASLETHASEALTYRTLVGYDETVGIMRDLGVGLNEDPAFKEFIGMLNTRHGLSSMPSLDSMLFRAAAREDAARFVDATIGELGLPVLRLSMEENIQGMPVLCVTAQTDKPPRLNQMRNRFEAPGILVMDDLDMWGVPQMPENMDGIGGFVMANISRGARAAVDLIRSAVEDPDVYVFATAQTGEEVDPFFYDLLEPLSFVDIDYPTDKERRDIWHQIALAHPSMRGINRMDLMRFSAGMPRYDLYMAAREALEEAYKQGLVSRTFVPVTPQNIFEKLACFQPIGSDEYQALEDEVVKDFLRDLDNLDGLLGDGR